MSNFLNNLTTQLEAVEKSLEKRLIRIFTASHIGTMVENRKENIKKMRGKSIDTIKTANNDYSSQFLGAAKSKWSKQSKHAFKKITKKLAK